jgi:hypothetical protein
MAAIDFPNSPEVDDLFTQGDITWQWDGTVWRGLGTTATGPAGVTISDDEPESNQVLWLDTDEEPDVPVPAGGSANQLLAKVDSTDYNTQWKDSDGVRVFADAAARGSAISSPVEGMAAYLEDSNLVSLYDGSAWKNSLATTGGILQVIQGVKTDVFSASFTTGQIRTITGLSATITPKSSTSQILVSYDISGGGGFGSALILRRAGTAISIGAADGSRTRVTGGAWDDINRRIATASAVVLDSPATTSAITYDLQILNVDSGTVTLYVNRSETDDNSASGARAASRITLMEVAG